MIDVGPGVIAVAGITMSGLIGPLITALVTRSNDRRRSRRDLARTEREELRRLFDDAAVLLGQGLRALRRGTAGADAWTADVFAMGQRLRLRLPLQDPVIRNFELVRDAYLDAARTQDGDDAARAVEARRDDFLARCRERLSNTEKVTR